jgi:predicted TIM-barrel fold metal-dependent hydrolase
MTQTQESRADASTQGTDENVIIVSCDGHVGPRLDEHLRQYCPQQYLAEFDEFSRQTNERQVELNAAVVGALSQEFVDTLRNNARSDGWYDPHVRLADYDRDGVAAGIIFHGTPNETGLVEQIPFQPSVSPLDDDELDSEHARELAAAGRQIYNRWLADFCSVAPERHIGLCQVPIWNIEETVKVVEWAAANGMRGVNFPLPQSWLPPYEDPSWDPLFAACADLNMPLVSHIGNRAVPPVFYGPGAGGVRGMECRFVSGRGLWHLIFGGVFDRHPALQFVLTEVSGTWWARSVHDMNSIYDSRITGEHVRSYLGKRPSEYMMENVYICESFQSRPEALTAVEEGVTSRVLWGSDYPHPESTWMFPESDDAPSTTLLSLANTYAGLSEELVRRMAGLNAIECYRLDSLALAQVAARIGPSVAQLTTAPDLSLVPAAYMGGGFRTEADGGN